MASNTEYKPVGETDIHGFDAIQQSVRGVLFLMLKFKFYKFSNEMPLYPVDDYIVNYGYEEWERRSKCYGQQENRPVQRNGSVESSNTVSGEAEEAKRRSNSASQRQRDAGFSDHLQALLNEGQ